MIIFRGENLIEVSRLVAGFAVDKFLWARIRPECPTGDALRAM
jgi:hypothetical protein